MASPFSHKMIFLRKKKEKIEAETDKLPIERKKTA